MMMQQRNPLGDDWARATREALSLATGPGSLHRAAADLRAAIATPLMPAAGPVRFGTQEALDSAIRQREMLRDALTA